MSLSNCHVCAGTKKIRQLGMMHADCPACDGTGKLTKEQIASMRVAAHPEPLQLPDDFYQTQRDAQAAKLKNANVAHLNRPIEIKNQQQAPSLDLHGNPIAPAIPSSPGMTQKSVAPVMDARATAAAATFENEVKVAQVSPPSPPAPTAQPPVAKTSGSKK
jgi:hypothetical protein